MESVKLYVMESYNELVNKVTWPSWASLQSNTVLVIIATLILSGIIFFMDAISKGILDIIYGLNSPT